MGGFAVMDRSLDREADAPVRPRFRPKTCAA